MRALLITAVLVITSGCSGKLAGSASADPGFGAGAPGLPVSAAMPPSTSTADSPSTTPTPFDAGGGVAPPESCTPGIVPTFVPLWLAPRGPGTGACSSAQISAAVPACFASGATAAGCQSWAQTSAATACLDCLVGPAAARSWGPIVYLTNLAVGQFVNVGGCVAMADSTQIACGQAIQAAFECEMASCLTLCPKPKAGDQGAMEALTACFQAADATQCSTYASAADTCTATLGAASSFCFQSAQGPGALEQVLNLACGQPDGG